MRREEMRRDEDEKALKKQEEHAGHAELERIVFIGRTFEEYMRMFALTEEELSGRRILDCPGGACSFTAVAHRFGCLVTAADIAYHHEMNLLHNKGLQDILHAMEHVEAGKERYIWTEFSSVDDLRKARTEALESCIKDMRLNPDRYVPVTLPLLPFEQGQFDLTLSAHFLFTYADKLDADFHRRTLHELLRVTREEVRIFPLVDQHGRRPALVDQLMEYACAEGWTAEIQSVPYHFQENADQVLILRRKE